MESQLYFPIYPYSHVYFRILERTSALVLELLQREEELKKAKTQVHKNPPYKISCPNYKYKCQTADVTKDQQRLIDMEDDYKKKVDVLNVQIKELKRENLDYETLKKQADQQAKEYNRLADEHNKLERTLTPTEAKKDI